MNEATTLRTERPEHASFERLRVLSATRLRTALSLLLTALLALSVTGCSTTEQPAARQTSNPKRPLAEVLQALPDYSGLSYIEVNDNEPCFSDDEMTAEGFETYSDLDLLGRCGTALASVGTETMPTGERGSISKVQPSGWEQEFYDFVDNEALYNRSHLIGWQLTGEDANERNLITGTRHMNADLMEPLESAIARYVRQTGNHVYYRVTPVFEDEELVARGVLMEAKSVEDDGAGICFCVYVYNVQPGVEIDYATGANWANGQSTATSQIDAALATGGTNGSIDQAETTERSASRDNLEAEGSTTEAAQTYVLNTNSHRFHRPDCSSVDSMNQANREDATATRSALIAEGYEPCGNCNP